MDGLAGGWLDVKMVLMIALYNNKLLNASESAL